MSCQTHVFDLGENIPFYYLLGEHSRSDSFFSLHMTTTSIGEYTIINQAHAELKHALPEYKRVFVVPKITT
jgi:hypothetical protein